MNDRIKLAEAMGWVRWEHPNRTHLAWTHPDIDKLAALECGLPDPFTDANDDYAVLEWMRVEVRREGISWLNGCGLLSLAAHNYQIGDYARACLKVLR